MDILGPSETVLNATLDGNDLQRIAKKMSITALEFTISVITFVSSTRTHVAKLQDEFWVRCNEDIESTCSRLPYDNLDNYFENNPDLVDFCDTQTEEIFVTKDYLHFFDFGNRFLFL